MIFLVMCYCFFFSLSLSESPVRLWVGEEVAAQISFLLGEFPSLFLEWLSVFHSVSPLHYCLQKARKVCQCTGVLVYTQDASRLMGKLLDLLSVYLSSSRKVLDILSFADILHFSSVQRFNSALERNVQLRLELFLPRAV